MNRTVGYTLEKFKNNQEIVDIAKLYSYMHALDGGYKIFLIEEFIDPAYKENVAKKTSKKKK